MPTHARVQTLPSTGEAGICSAAWGGAPDSRSMGVHRKRSMCLPSQVDREGRGASARDEAQKGETKEASAARAEENPRMVPSRQAPQVLNGR